MKAGDKLLILSATLLSLLVFLQAILTLTVDYADKKIAPTPTTIRCDICGHKIDINEPYVCQGAENHWHAGCYLNKVQKEKNDEKITDYAA